MDIMPSKKQTEPVRKKRILRRRRHAGITIGPVQKLIINLFTLCDGVNALTDRKYFADRSRPYAYQAYLNMAEAKTFGQKMQVIWEAKKDKTRKIMWAKKRYGKVPARYVAVCKKTPCGRLRLFAANL